MRLPVLDLYVLSLLDHGLETAYSFQREVGLSLGASTPSLRRLMEARLVKRKEEEGTTNRPRHVYTLTLSGRERARNGWREYLHAGRLPSDLDSILRLSDMAAHYGASAAEVARFLKTASERTATISRRVAAVPEPGNGLMYLSMRSRCEAARLKAESDVLGQMAAEISTGRSRLLRSRKKSKSTSGVPQKS
jgi:DNA-binding PadR family transcriptional regulator